jgi:hypothetical protein
MQRPVAPRQSSSKTIRHPHAGPITLDCYTVEVRDSDLT